MIWAVQVGCQAANKRELMTTITDVSNDFIRQEIEEYIERPDER